MVADLIRDSAFGHVVRAASRGKVFAWPEQTDHGLWNKYVNDEKSANMARYGSVEPPRDEHSRGARGREDGSDSDASSHTQVADGGNEASGARVDPEKGKDRHVVDWYGPDDPGVRSALSRFPYLI